MLHATPHKADAAVNTTTPAPEDQATPVAVGESAAGEDQHRKRERVGIQRPLQAAQTGS